MVAIAVALSLIYPNLQVLNDQIQVSDITTNLSAFDDTFRTLMTQPVGSTASISLKGSNAVLFGDNQSYIRIIPFINGTDMNGTLTRIPFTRMVIETPVQSNTYAAGTHQYLKGTADQDFFSLNTSTASTTPWSIYNISRAQSSNDINASLGYRLLFTHEFKDGNQIITTISYVSLHFADKTVLPFQNKFLKISFDKVDTQTIFSKYPNPGDRNIKITLDVNLVQNNPFIEIPFKFDGGAYSWTLQLKSYSFTVDL